MASGWKHLDGERMVTIRWDERFPAAFVWVRTLEEEIPNLKMFVFTCFVLVLISETSELQHDPRMIFSLTLDVYHRVLLCAERWLPVT